MQAVNDNKHGVFILFDNVILSLFKHCYWKSFQKRVTAEEIKQRGLTITFLEFNAENCPENIAFFFRIAKIQQSLYKCPTIQRVPQRQQIQHETREVNPITPRRHF